MCLVQSIESKSDGIGQILLRFGIGENARSLDWGYLLCWLIPQICQGKALLKVPICGWVMIFGCWRLMSVDEAVQSTM